MHANVSLLCTCRVSLVSRVWCQRFRALAFLSTMRFKAHVALWLIAAARYGFSSPGSNSPSLADNSSSLADMHVSAAATINDSVNLIQQVNTVPQCASLLTSQVYTAPQCAPLRLVALNVSHETSPWASVVTSSAPLAVADSANHPLAHSEYRDAGRPPDPEPIPKLNVSMIERFLLELLFYLGFENLRRPLSVYGTIALVYRLWLGISATLFWFFNFCACVARFAVACASIMALRVTFVALHAICYAMWFTCYAIWFACSLACNLLGCTVNLTRSMGNSIAGLALYMCAMTVAYSST